jgi:hypothetical protein
MARAWHEGRKTVTRRILKTQPPSAYKPTGYGIDQWGESKGKWGVEFHDCAHEAKFYPCPYPPGSTVIIAEPLVNVGGIVKYAADQVAIVSEGVPLAWGWKVNSLSGRYMPNWAARSWARIVSVRAERLQEITEEDALLEGIAQRSKDNGRTWKYGITDRSNDPGTDGGIGWPWHEWARSGIEAYATLIDKVNKPGTWQANPFVFRYELEKLDRLEAVK